MVFVEIVQDTITANQFETAFGQRFVSLIDFGSTTYGVYQAPFRVAPYPLVYVLDRDGIVRYWDTEYDPAAIVAAIDGLLDAVDVIEAEPPRRAGLRVVPNPMVGRGVVSFGLPARGPFTISLFDVLGRRVRTLAQGERDAGVHEIPWNGKGANGRPLPGGVYFLRLEASGVETTGRVILRR